MRTTCDSTKLVSAELLTFYRENKFGEDGGANKSLAKVKLGWLTLYIPNTAGRKRALFFHDVHHLATGYGTDLRGEGEISAWELASGCRRYLAAWLLDSIGMSLGLLIAPRRTLKAFWYGRQCRNLYHGLISRDEIKSATVEEIRLLLGLKSLSYESSTEPE